jgi:hypothetical protein
MSIIALAYMKPRENHLHIPLTWWSGSRSGKEIVMSLLQTAGHMEMARRVTMLNIERRRMITVLLKPTFRSVRKSSKGLASG